MEGDLEGRIAGRIGLIPPPVPSEEPADAGAASKRKRKRKPHRGGARVRARKKKKKDAGELLDRGYRVVFVNSSTQFSWLALRPGLGPRRQRNRMRGRLVYDTGQAPI